MPPCVTVAKHPFYLHSAYVIVLHQKTPSHNLIYTVTTPSVTVARNLAGHAHFLSTHVHGY